MVTAWLATLAFASIQDSDTYVDKSLGLSFAHPKTWVLQRPDVKSSGKRGRTKLDNETVRFKIPIAGSTDDAELMIIRAEFSGSPELWQQIQLNTNRLLKREIVQTSQQEVLGVPLLLTRITFAEDGVSKTTLTGLLYNDWPYKLLFRLTGTAANFDRAQFEFNQSLESLRTLGDGQVKAQQPDKAPTKRAVEVAAAAEAKKNVISAEAPPAPTVKAPNQVTLTVAARKVVVHIPLGWKSKVDDATLELTNELSGQVVSLAGFSVRDSDTWQVALNKATAADLDRYSKVDRRDDPAVKPNRAGQPLATVWRIGAATEGPLATVQAVIVSEEVYLLGKATLKPGTTYATDRAAILDLLSQVSLEAAP